MEKENICLNLSESRIFEILDRKALEEKSKNLTKMNDERTVKKHINTI